MAASTAARRPAPFAHGRRHSAVRACAPTTPQPAAEGRTTPRRLLLATAAGLAPALALAGCACASDERVGKVAHSAAEWRALLPAESYRVLRDAWTELPGSSPLNKEHRAGTFTCRGCEANLFPSTAKFDSGTGWPSFYAALPGAVREVGDYSIPFLPRAEVRCTTCEGHLGHVFADGPPPTGMRYCMNGAALAFVPTA